MFNDVRRLMMAIKDYIPEENWSETIKNIDFENIDDVNTLDTILKYCPSGSIEDFLTDIEFSIEDTEEAIILLNHGIDYVDGEEIISWHFDIEDFLYNIDEFNEKGLEILSKFIEEEDLSEYNEDIIVKILKSDLVDFSKDFGYDNDFNYCYGYPDEIVSSESKLSNNAVENLIMALGTKRGYYYIDFGIFGGDRWISMSENYQDVYSDVYERYRSTNIFILDCQDIGESKENIIQFLIKNYNHSREELTDDFIEHKLTYEEVISIYNHFNWIKRL